MDILEISKPHYISDRIVVLKGDIYSFRNSFVMSTETSCNFTKKSVECICVGYNDKIITNDLPIIGSKGEYFIETLKAVNK